MLLCLVCVKSQFISNAQLTDGSEEESGKEWSDLEAEAAEEDRNRDNDAFTKQKKPSHTPSRHSDNHRSSKHNGRSVCAYESNSPLNYRQAKKAEELFTFQSYQGRLSSYF